MSPMTTLLGNPVPEKPAIIDHIWITERHPRLRTFGKLVQFPRLQLAVVISTQNEPQRDKSVATSF